MLFECSQTQLDVGIGRAVVEQSERLGHYEATRGRPHKRNGDRFPSELESAAFVESRTSVRFVLIRNAIPVSLAPLLLFFGQVRPEFVGRSGDSEERGGSTCRSYSTSRRARFRPRGRILPRRAHAGEGSNRIHITRASAHRTDSENGCRTDVLANVSGSHGLPTKRHKSALWCIFRSVCVNSRPVSIFSTSTSSKSFRKIRAALAPS